MPVWHEGRRELPFVFASGEAYRHGAAPKLDRASQGSLAAGAALLATRGRRSWLYAGIAGGLLCAGALCARWSVFRAGFRSAADPKYVVGPQRAAIERGERPGAARRDARGAAADDRPGSLVTAQRLQRKPIA